MELKELQKDKRGSVHLLEFEGKEYLLLFTKAGHYRGGEIHRGQQINFLINGTQEWSIGANLKRVFGPEMIKIPAHTPHLMFSQSNSLMIEFREFSLENPVIYYEPYRKFAEESKIEK